MECLDFAKNAIKIAAQKGAVRAEADIDNLHSWSIEIRNGRADNLVYGEEYGLAIRVQSATGEVRFGCTLDFTDKGVEDLLDGLLFLPAYTEQRDDELLLPTGVNLLNGPAIYDPLLERISVQERIDRILELTYRKEDCKKLREKVDWRISYEDSLGETAVANSEGFEGTYQWTSCYSYARCISTKGRVGENQLYSRRLQNVLVPQLTWEATRALEYDREETHVAGEYEVKLSCFAAATLLMCVSEAFFGDNIARQLLFLHDACGKRIASPEVDIVDDGGLDWAVGSSPFDDEGVPPQRTEIVASGFYRRPMRNLASAS